MGTGCLVSECALRHNPDMRAITAIATSLSAALAAVVLLAACTGNSSGSHGSDPTSATSPVGDPATAVSTPVTEPVSTPTSTTPTAPTSPPATPTSTPTVPSDVPTIGHNSRPGETPPVEPVAALAHTRAGAAAFAVFFIKTIDWGYATTSSTYMRHYFTHSCVNCRSVALAIDHTARAHRRLIGDRFIDLRASIANANASTMRATVTFTITAVEVLGPNGKFVSGNKTIHGYGEAVAVRWGGSHWTVTQMAPST